jgi:membrane protein YqaA with SNARE-associated domain
MGELLLHGAAFAFGIGSAILPMFLNAEVYVVAMGATIDSWTLFWGVLALGIGTVVGKAIVFQLVRSGSERYRRQGVRRPPRNRVTAWLRRTGDLLLTWLDRPVAGAATVFLSSLTAVPPLAVVTILAPLSRQRLWVFLLMVFLGRTLQFLALAFLIQGLDVLELLHRLW